MENKAVRERPDFCDSIQSSHVSLNDLKQRKLIKVATIDVDENSNISHHLDQSNLDLQIENKDLNLNKDG